MKTKYLHVRIEEDLKDRADQIAQKHHINLSAVIRGLLLKWVEEMELRKEKEPAE